MRRMKRESAGFAGLSMVTAGGEGEADMTLVFGRKRLIISLTSEKSDPILDRYPMAYQASDRELARLNKFGIGVADRIGHDVHRVMHGAGWVR
jgi:hypothetical protein